MTQSGRTVAKLIIDQTDRIYEIELDQVQVNMHVDQGLFDLPLIEVKVEGHSSRGMTCKEKEKEKPKNRIEGIIALGTVRYKVAGEESDQ